MVRPFAALFARNKKLHSSLSIQCSFILYCLLNKRAVGTLRRPVQPSVLIANLTVFTALAPSLLFQHDAHCHVISLIQLRWTLARTFSSRPLFKALVICWVFSIMAFFMCSMLTYLLTCFQCIKNIRCSKNMLTNMLTWST